MLVLAGGTAAAIATASAPAAGRIPVAGAQAFASHACHDADAEAATSRPRREARSTASRALLCLVAQLRARHELAPLRWSPRLARAARRHARDMVHRRYFSHTTPEGGKLLDRLRGYAAPAPAWWVGEVLAWGAGARSRPRGVLRAWLASPSHRRILLTRHARDIGIGIAFGAPVRARARRSATFVIELGWRGADRGAG